LFGVADGHGQYGREVSNFCKMLLPVIIEENTTKEIIKQQDEEGEGIARMISNAFEECHEGLRE
jgi:serine/threonine protein phosphatase PrpC